MIVFVLLGALVYGGFASGSESYPSVEWMTILAVLMMVFAAAVTANFWLYPVREARFYEDHAELSGKADFRFSYSQVVQLERVRGFGLLSPSDQVHITLEGQDEPIRIYGNPNNRYLNTNLYSWLWRKTEANLAKKVYLTGT